MIGEAKIRQDAQSLAEKAGPAVEVVRAGALTTVQDLGRPGLAHLGVGRSGALDQGAHRLANRLVGNDSGAATLETTVTGVTLRTLSPVTVAVCGAVASVSVDGAPAAWAAPIRLAAGSVLDVGPAIAGVRCYIALSGGVAVAQELDSRSTDLLSGIGPAPLRNGDVLPLGHARRKGGPAGADVIAETGADADAGTGAGSGAGESTAEGDGASVTAVEGADVVPVSAPARDIELPLWPGPRPERFAPSAWDLLEHATYTVTSASNRIGLRLDGPALARVGPDTGASEGMVLGAVQVPADGRPIIFLADHPTTGGYPVIGVVPRAALDLVAQAAPGTVIRFRLARR